MTAIVQGEEKKYFQNKFEIHWVKLWLLRQRFDCIIRDICIIKLQL
jgi:hypothetical protein